METFLLGVHLKNLRTQVWHMREEHSRPRIRGKPPIHPPKKKQNRQVGKQIFASHTCLSSF